MIEEVVIDTILGEQQVGQSESQRGVAAGARIQPAIGTGGQADAARIDDDEPRAAPLRRYERVAIWCVIWYAT